MAKTECIRYSSNYKCQLADTYKIKTLITSEDDIDIDFIALTAAGNLLLMKGYAQDGPSRPINFPYNGPHHKLVKACTKADRIVASTGIFRKGIGKTAIGEVEPVFPNFSFYTTLLGLAKKLGDVTLVGRVKLM